MNTTARPPSAVPFLLMAACLGTLVLGCSPTGPGPDPNHFDTLPPGTALPSDADCARRVRRSSFEPRPDNAAANRTSPGAVTLEDWTSVDPRANSEIKARVTGNFSGTTDEIIQWASCKWGVDEDVTRAVAANESWWHQDTGGDWVTEASKCPAGWPQPCPTSWGLMQVKWYDYAGTFPASRASTAFNVDYALAVRRACFEGYISWLKDVQPTAGYGPGDAWGCVGFWFSGRWHDAGAERYVTDVKNWLDQKVWLTDDFACQKALAEPCGHDWECCTEACSPSGRCCRQAGTPAQSASECCSGALDGSRCQ